MPAYSALRSVQFCCGENWGIFTLCELAGSHSRNEVVPFLLDPVLRTSLPEMNVTLPGLTARRLLPRKKSHIQLNAPFTSFLLFQSAWRWSDTLWK